MQTDTTQARTEKAMAQGPNHVLPPEEQKMLTVSSSRFGEIKANPAKVITMTSPFLGFPDSKRFMLIPHGEDTPFMWLQSLDDPRLAFVVIPAFALVPEYNPALPAQARQELKAEAEDELNILLLLTIPHNDPQKMTANLLGPLMINPEHRLAKQIILDPNKWDPRWPVFTEDGK
jgi:flagellar assembly factor FliW